MPHLALTPLPAGPCPVLCREADILTPMMTQITFEGLIDEVTGIKHGAVPWVQKGGRTVPLAPCAGSTRPVFCIRYHRGPDIHSTTSLSRRVPHALACLV